MKTYTATYIQEVRVTDPDTRKPVEIAIYKHDHTGAMFGVDTKFINENFDEDETPTIADPFNNEAIVELDSNFEGTEGQDRETYSDDQDRDSYSS